MFAVLHIADFSLQAVLRIERELAGRAVALVDDSARSPVVVACTARAQAAGVQLGSTPSQAMARCPDIVLRTRRSDAEAEARASLLAAAFAIAPQVEDTAPGVCTLQVAGVAADRREPVLRLAVAQLVSLGLVATAGLAPTPLLALYAARYGGTTAASSPSGVLGFELGVAGSAPVRPAGEAMRWVAAEHAAGFEPGSDERPASNVQHPTSKAEHRTSHSSEPETQNSKPETPGSDPATARLRAPTVLAAAWDVRAFLRDLPLVVAEPTPDIATILAGWGVRTLGQLTALTKADVTQRLGPEGLALWERAAGEVDRPLRLTAPAQTFQAAMDLEHPVETLEPLLFLLRRFIDRLALELRTAGYVAGEMTLELKLADETVHRRDFRLPEPTAQEEILFRVLHTHLEALHTASEVQGLRLDCRPVRPLNRQQGLFENALRDPHGFAETLARVAAMVGADRVGTPVVENTHRPDAFRLGTPPPVVGPPPSEVEPPRHGPPLRRYRPPLPAKVELRGQTPAFVWTPRVVGGVCARSGPWRGSGDWWDAARVWRREEWDVELETGGVYRLLHTPDGWFLEGEYD